MKVWNLVNSELLILIGICTKKREREKEENLVERSFGGSSHILVF